MLEVQPHAVMVLADTALRGDQLDEAAALAARNEAAKALEGVGRQTPISPRPTPSSPKQKRAIARLRSSKAER